MGRSKRSWICCRDGAAAESAKDAKVDEGQLTRVEAIINSMTNQERRDHNVIDGKRRKRIAKGSGTNCSRRQHRPQAIPANAHDDEAIRPPWLPAQK